jgi:hypothetical protein
VLIVFFAFLAIHLATHPCKRTPSKHHRIIVD